MSAFARGERASATTMTAMMKALDVAERAKIAKYLAGL
jgi:cytochrome c553